ncbi:MAG: hypothetical protein FJ333_05700 [Sphingomonadales bacterium]|nr:hypothetical protein [Sphingomonadales bacterium]
MWRPALDPAPEQATPGSTFAAIGMHPAEKDWNKPESPPNMSLPAPSSTKSLTGQVKEGRHFMWLP